MPMQRLRIESGERLRVQRRLSYLLCLLLLGAAPPPKVHPVTRVILRPAPGALDKQERGDVIIEYTDGSRARLTNSGMAAAPRLAPDGRTVGYVALRFETYRSERVLAYAQIVIFRDGRRLSTLQPEKIAELTWDFRQGGQQVAVASAGMHGPTYLQLFDVTTGKQLAVASGSDDSLPQWAAGLEVR